MKVVRLKAPGGLENLKLAEEDHPDPKLGEILVRVRACSLNFHDNMVALGKKPCADGRIPLSDGAGEVIAVGDGVSDFEVGDAVVSTYWPYWLSGDPTPVNTYACLRTASRRRRRATPILRRLRLHAPA
jgi:NADPH:quinone reductase-like Zn-dependent oxidoreductase